MPEDRESGTTSRWAFLHFVDYCTIVLYVYTAGICKGGFCSRITREEKLSAAEMIGEEERVRVAEGLEGGECDLCIGSIYKEGRQTAIPVTAVLNIDLMPKWVTVHWTSIGCSARTDSVGKVAKPWFYADSQDCILENGLIQPVTAVFHTQFEKMKMKNRLLEKDNWKVLSTTNKYRITSINPERKRKHKKLTLKAILPE